MAAGEITGKTYDIQGFSVQDGPGVRTTVFLKGCPLRCPWCHSPESQRFDTELNWMNVRCLGIDACGMCLGVCPNGCVTRGVATVNAVGAATVYPSVDKSRCDECGACARACRAGALYMCGADMTVDEVLRRIERDMPFYEDSGGGVTVSGGECLAQPEFTLELLRRCKALGVHTAVDTTGFVPWSVTEKTLPYTDMYLYDLKCMDAVLHERVIGVPNGLILENAAKLAAAGGKLWIRIPVMPMFNDSREHFEEYIRFLDALRGAVIMIQLLPYHKMGLSKYDRLLTPRRVFSAEPPADSLMESRREMLASAGFPVRVH
ncbi:MAG: glycyl-radical enzyme activating protein [Oscillospiraceae bacterium]|nr:glycyl-radical enzyme activating protein [Oscillospiraceae bacterium]